MKTIIERLVLEVTRRCNHNCAHCMRGPKENLDMSKELIDIIINDNVSYKIINFSGGEPTLNPDVIIYTIDRIIEKHIPVRSIQMITNGLIFNPDLVDAFNRFVEYRRNIFEEEIKKASLPEEIIEELRDYYELTNYSACIDFSNSKYHPGVSKEIKKQYIDRSKGIRINDYNLTEWQVVKTGNATFGEEYKPGFNPLLIDYDEKNDTQIFLSNELYKFYQKRNIGKDYYSDKLRKPFGYLYITANGEITSNGFGTFKDIDKYNYGGLGDFNPNELVEAKLAFLEESDERLLLEDVEKCISQKHINPYAIPKIRRINRTKIYSKKCIPIDKDAIMKILGLENKDNEKNDRRNILVKAPIDYSNLPKELHDFIYNEAPKGFDDLIYSKAEAVTYRPRRKLLYPAYEPIEKRKQYVKEYKPLYNKEDYK